MIHKPNLVLAVFVGLLLNAWAQERVIMSPDSFITNRAVLTDAKAETVQTGSGKALRIVFGHASSYPHIRFEPERAGFSPDWSGFTFLGLTVENAAKEPVRINVRVDSASNETLGRQGGESLLPGEKRRLVMSLGGAPIIGMRGQPPAQGAKPTDVIITPSPVTLNAQKITHFQIFVANPEKDSTILIHRIELFGDSRKGPGAFVDRFGQYNGADWPGKLHDEKEFAARIKVEQADLAQYPSLPGRDNWGGWANGPTLKATGRFYPAKYNGKWWLVDPDGKLFWSSGITCVRVGQSTRTAGREQYFEWLPRGGDPLAQFASGAGEQGRTMNFFAANLSRKYGPDYQDRYYDSAVKRFRSWGITTVANWSDYEEISRRKGVPYTIPIEVRVKMFPASEHLKAGLVKKKYFPDVFDPGFAQGIEEALLQNAAPHKDDPWLLGVFVHNELQWVGGDTFKNPDEAQRISAIAFKNDGSFAIKKALVQALRKKFASTTALNKFWGTEFENWEEVLGPVTFTKAQLKNGAALFGEFDGLIAEQYFRTISQAMKKILPGVLYLGCRFSNYSDEVVRPAAKYCDVVSFNIYAYLPEERLADELSAKYDFPVVIGEFHFGALDRGMFDPGLRKAANQADRAAKYMAYVEQAARGAWCVGAHWFQYVDQPLTGRDDGENYNIGFLNATDDPYPEMVAAARKVNASIYKIRMGP